MYKRIVATAALTLGLAGAATAEPLSYRDGKGQLYSARANAVDVQILRPDLFPDKLDKAIAKVLREQKYYSAAAFSPSKGPMDKALTLAVNYHSAEDAGAAAVAGCNGRIGKDDAKCVVGAVGVPKGYKGRRAFQLNMDATAAFTKEYRKLKEPRAMAISLSTGQWGIGNGAPEAIAACTTKGAQDCAVVAAD